MKPQRAVAPVLATGECAVGQAERPASLAGTVAVLADHVSFVELDEFDVAKGSHRRAHRAHSLIDDGDVIAQVAVAQGVESVKIVAADHRGGAVEAREAVHGDAAVLVRAPHLGTDGVQCLEDDARLSAVQLVHGLEDEGGAWLGPRDTCQAVRGHVLVAVNDEREVVEDGRHVRATARERGLISKHDPLRAAEGEVLDDGVVGLVAHGGAQSSSSVVGGGGAEGILRSCTAPATKETALPAASSGFT
eukprot:CAMPEP_0206045162 /NCGR_PEP_ID=MMETSP1466-20131121/15114_1 /ASSEMBLY_ACC=CAM_ASM_001126 /TAXON_ID=44452 /ORGANISM="Pavlova gyrans, Strain CCMP608" /LENGTH=247 /DNA_ID=CAMNT_0053420089 /DNA_START=72 /DNA_END=814 /DNA_ORIENTATION=+